MGPCDLAHLSSGRLIAKTESKMENCSLNRTRDVVLIGASEQQGCLKKLLLFEGDTLTARALEDIVQNHSWCTNISEDNVAGQDQLP